MAPSRAPERALTMPWKCPGILLVLYERNLIGVFPYLISIQNIYIALPLPSCEAERNFAKL
jgi:hypothetical protein